MSHVTKSWNWAESDTRSTTLVRIKMHLVVDHWHDVCSCCWPLMTWLVQQVMSSRQRSIRECVFLRRSVMLYFLPVHACVECTTGIRNSARHVSRLDSAAASILVHSLSMHLSFTSLLQQQGNSSNSCSSLSAAATCCCWGQQLQLPAAAMQ